MRSVILFIELLRSRPSAVFWTAALAQTASWWLVPALFYGAPPDGLAMVLAVGHQFQLGSEFGPPLAFWLAEIVYSVAGLAGVYLAAQVCVLVALWAMFALGRAIVGDRHAALAVLLMTGIFAFTMPSAEFGPGIAALPLWALALLHYWRAAGQGRQLYWLALGIDLGLLILTTYAGLVLLALLLAFTLATSSGRAQLIAIEPWLGGVAVVGLLFPHLIWLDQTGGVALASLGAIEQNLNAWLVLVALLFAGHAGPAILAAIGHGVPAAREAAPELKREPVDPEARHFILIFAVAPLIGSIALALFVGGAHSYVTAPLALLSALAVMVAAPDRIRIAHQRLIAWAFAALLMLPPLGVAGAIALLPWLYPIELKLAQPAAAIGQFFGESFQSRTGQPLMFVGGDARLASLIALAAPGRPNLYLDATPELTPWVTPQQIATKGLLVIWPAGDTRLPPAAIRERFPGLAVESPQAFARPGRLPPLRIGWGVVGPALRQ